MKNKSIITIGQNENMLQEKKVLKVCPMIWNFLHYNLSTPETQYPKDESLQNEEAQISSLLPWWLHIKQLTILKPKEKAHIHAHTY